MQTILKAAIVCCSNGLSPDAGRELQQLKRVLESNGIMVLYSDCIYAENGTRGAAGRQRAAELMHFYEQPDVDVIFDVSGGDIANEILPYLDYGKIAAARDSLGRPKQLWGYSDLTVVLNAVYAKTGRSGVLYQVRHLAAERDGRRTQEFVKLVRERQLRTPDYSFIQGNSLSGVVVGGNIRCLLKLAGTEYFPDMTDKILLLEARSGLRPQMITYLSQLKQLGVFEKISGILLGTFTQWEQLTGGYREDNKMEQLVKEVAGEQKPIIKTPEIGHSVDAGAIWIGEWMQFEK